MKKSEFIDEIAKKTSISKKDIDLVMSGAMETIKESLMANKTITFMGFGSFSTVMTTAKKTKLPGSGRIIDVPAGKRVKFKVGKNLKESVFESTTEEDIKEVESKDTEEKAPQTNKKAPTKRAKKDSVKFS
jgi:DNA-binding protein HU-beta